VTRVRNFVLLPVVACMFVTVLALRVREDDAKFARGQKVATPVLTKAVEAAVRVAPEFRKGPQANSATCKSAGPGQIGNPWRCVLHYADADLPFKVYVSGNQSWIAYGTGESKATINGCCVRFGRTG